MIDILAFLKSSPGWGYLIVFLGAMVEGETIVLGASALAAIGVLSLTKVASLAFLSTLFVDQILYFVGRHFYKKPGVPLSEKYPKLYRKSKRAVLLLKKYDIWFILMFRFIYGIRAVSPIVIALCGSKPSRFIPLNFISAVIWTVLSCGLGYKIGDWLFDLEQGVVKGQNLHYLQYGILGMIVLIVVSIAISHLIRRLWKNRRKKFLPGVNRDISQHVEQEFYKATHVRADEASLEKDNVQTVQEQDQQDQQAQQAQQDSHNKA